VSEHLAAMGQLMMDGWLDAAGACGLSIHVDGFPSLASFGFHDPDELTLATLFTELMLEKGFLAFTQFKPSYAHSRGHIDAYLEAVRDTFRVVAEAAAHRDAGRRLHGPVARRGFYRLT
jgi:hypothetical protein